MTDKKQAIFSRQDQLRLEYLLSHFDYLNEKDLEEFHTLHLRMKAFLAEHGVAKETAETKVLETDNAVVSNEGLVSNSSSVEASTLSKIDTEDTANQGDYELDHQSETATHKNGQYNRRNKQNAIPKKKNHRFKKLLKIILFIILLLLLGMIGMFIKGLYGVSSQNTDVKPAMTAFFDGQESRDGTNILILGSDQRLTEASSQARTDTIMVMNIGGQDGKMKLVSFMRDTLVTIPGASGEGMFDHKLNSAFTIGEQDNHQGAELMRVVLKENFDIDIKYYIMIDFQTFAEAVDTLFPKGVLIDAQFATVDGQVVDTVAVPDDLRMTNGIVPEQTISVGKQRMDGRTLLNYARFRKDDEGDFGRTKRQQQVMTAMLSQIKDPTKLFTGSEALGKIYALTSTNVSYPLLLSEGLSAFVKGDSHIERVTVPKLGDWQDDYDSYGGQGLLIDMVKYQEELRELGLR